MMHDAREGSSDKASASIPPTPDEDCPSNRPRRLSERLYAARKRKGVDLYRAERETKIRARYLGALERGDDADLPGGVYTKGFLRNYALYLGLDPDEALSQWRRERGERGERAERRAQGSRSAYRRPPTHRWTTKRPTFSPGMVVVALLAIVVLGFGAYLGIQILRFTKPPSPVRERSGDGCTGRCGTRPRPIDCAERRCLELRSRSRHRGAIRTE